MKYIVPLQYDSNREPMGLFSAFTTAGPVVVIFSNMEKWSRFSGAVAPILRREDMYLASVTLEADSFEEAVGQIVELYPAILDEGSFLPDSAPLVEDIIGFFEGQTTD